MRLHSDPGHCETVLKCTEEELDELDGEFLLGARQQMTEDSHLADEGESRQRGSEHHHRSCSPCMNLQTAFFTEPRLEIAPVLYPARLHRGETDRTPHCSHRYSATTTACNNVLDGSHGICHVTYSSHIVRPAIVHMQRRSARPGCHCDSAGRNEAAWTMRRGSASLARYNSSHLLAR